jgi:ribosomal protein L29
MATHLSAKELRNMQTEELQKEVMSKKLLVSKMRIDVQIGSEKDTARFLREKKEFARLMTVLTERMKTEKKAAPAGLKKVAKASKMSAPKAKKASSPARRSS